MLNDKNTAGMLGDGMARDFQPGGLISPKPKPSALQGNLAFEYESAKFTAQNVLGLEALSGRIPPIQQHSHHKIDELMADVQEDRGNAVSSDGEDSVSGDELSPTKLGLPAGPRHAAPGSVATTPFFEAGPRGSRDSELKSGSTI